MSHYPFILQPGQWIGEGKITFSTSPDSLRFYTKWVIEEAHSGIILCKQRVQMEGREEDLYNNFMIYKLESNAFSIQLNSELLGTLEGKGVIDDKTIAWEFRYFPEFEGFEVYELINHGDYNIHAEYISTDEYRTMINGRLWKKSE